MINYWVVKNAKKLSKAQSFVILTKINKVYEQKTVGNVNEEKNEWKIIWWLIKVRNITSFNI